MITFPKQSMRKHLFCLSTWNLPYMSPTFENSEEREDIDIKTTLSHPQGSNP